MVSPIKRSQITMQFARMIQSVCSSETAFGVIVVAVVVVVVVFDKDLAQASLL